MIEEKLYKILTSDIPSKEIKKNEEYIFRLIPKLKECVGFDQKSKWHIYDVYEHILHVVDGVDNKIELRLAALFHDIGKPDCFTLDENNEGHFKGHWIKSEEIFNTFASKYNLDKDFSLYISKLILNHDIRLEKMTKEEIDQLPYINDKKFIKDLFIIKRSDLLAQNKEYHYLLNEYKKQEEYLLSK